MTSVVVRSWDQIDVQELASCIRVIAFDLDNTLAVSKQPMKPDMTSCLTRLTQLVPVAIITGGRWELVASQILNVLGEDADLRHLHLMPTSGSSYYQWDGDCWRCVYSRTLSQDDRDATIASLTRHAKEQGIWPEHAWGNLIEDRGSQITFSALGQQAPTDAKQAWDPDDMKKSRLVEAVRKDLPHLRVRAGGYTSVDVSEANIDKAFAVHELARRLDVLPSQIVFVGDRMTPDGNDYPAAEAGAIALRVSGPEDTVVLCERLIAALANVAQINL